MNVNLGIWTKLTRAAVFLLFVAGLLLVSVWYLPLIKENERYRKEILRFDERIQKAEETERQLKTAIDALRFDPKAVERVARIRLGYAKAGETVIRFEESSASSTSRR